MSIADKNDRIVTPWRSNGTEFLARIEPGACSPIFCNGISFHFRRTSEYLLFRHQVPDAKTRNSCQNSVCRQDRFRRRGSSDA